MKQYTNEWMRHLRPQTSGVMFPRRVGWPFQRSVFNREQYLAFARDNSGKHDCFTAVFSECQIRNAVYDTIYMDLDFRDDPLTKDNYEHVKDFFRFIKDKGIEPRVYFSGNKGFHFWIDFDTVEIPNYAFAIKRWTRKEKILAFDFIDAVVLHAERISRIPFTIHPKSGLMCIPLPDFANMSLRELKRLLLSPTPVQLNVTHNDSIGRELHKLGLTAPRVKTFASDTFENFDAVYPDCITSAINKLIETGELVHYRRLHLVMFLRTIGASFEDVMKFFKCANDFRSNRSTYQIKYTLDGTYFPYKCSKAVTMNICPLSEKERLNCPYYPSILKRLNQIRLCNEEDST